MIDERLINTELYLDECNNIRGNVQDATYKYLMMRRTSYYCDCCGIKEWQGLPLRLEVDHIDGNRNNVSISNFRLLCPSCHDQTDTNAAHKTEKQTGAKRKAENIVAFCEECGVPLLKNKEHIERHICLDCQHLRHLKNLESEIVRYYDDDEFPFEGQHNLRSLAQNLSRFTCGEIREKMRKAVDLRGFLISIQYYDDYSTKDIRTLEKLCFRIHGERTGFLDIIWNTGKRAHSHDNIFRIGSRISNFALKQAYVKESGIAYECSICGVNTWCNLPSVLILDHINGNHSDNRIENLRLVCGNCDSQLDTSRDRNSNKHIHSVGNKIESECCRKCGGMLVEHLPYCPNCGVDIPLVKRSKYMTQEKPKYTCCDCGAPVTTEGVRCLECSRKAQRRCKHPTREQLKDLIRSQSFTNIAREYGVSDNAVKKWYKGYGLPSKASDIKRYSDEQWNSEEWDAIAPIQKNSLAEDTPRIVEMYASGKTIKEIAMATYHHDTEVSRVLRDSGCEIKSSGEMRSERNGAVVMLPENVTFASARKAAEYILAEQDVHAKRSTVSARIRSCVNGTRATAYGHQWVRAN